ncbi:hypothetical protein QP185_02445 [Sphingomonas aerolata]|uniref:hypothetical protein n=1 Tax=Sphingomonas aerolata TaxID=185951 RepID=UPI002FDF46FC
MIEVSLIVSLMLSDAGDAAALARDTVFAAIMIILNFIIGLCLLAERGATSRTAFHVKGDERRAGRAGGDVGSLADPAQLHLVDDRADLCAVAAGVRRDRLAGALRYVRAGPDGPSPRLFPALG